MSQSAFGTGGLDRVENMLVVSERFNSTRFCLVAPLALCRFGTVGSTGGFERYREITERMTDNVGIVILKRFTACFAGMKSISLFFISRLDNFFGITVRRFFDYRAFRNNSVAIGTDKISRVPLFAATRSFYVLKRLVLVIIRIR